MRRLTPLLLLLLLAALLEPIGSAALSNPMPCCMGPGAAMCCPLNGSCVMKSCQGSEYEGRVASLSLFVLASPVGLARPENARLSIAARGAWPESFRPSLLDPPPRS